MAKLGTFYALCPLIDTKCCFGVTEDSQKGTVITTLGKNMASRYKVSDQKQISCWGTKDKFSSPIIYDNVSAKYVAVFNKSFIRMWDKDENLDKVKKYKFINPIHTLIAKNGQSFIVFQNGALYKLEEALEQRKTLITNIPELDQIEEVICEQINNELYFGMIVKTEETHLYWTTFESSKTVYRKIILMRDEVTLAGCLFHKLENKMHLFSLWSDGSFYAFPLEETDSGEDNVGRLFSVVESVSTKHPVSMTSLDENYIALYGANSNEEGAVLVIYNTQFRVTQSKQPFKLFTSNAKVWQIENNILLPVGQNLCVIPFHLETEHLAALVGSHKVWQDGLDSDIKLIQELDVASWDETLKVKPGNMPKILSDKIKEMMQQGLPESIILDELLPDIFEKRDIKAIHLLMKHFSDISEKHLSKILKFVLDLDNHDNSVLESLQPSRKTKLINMILCKSFSEAFLLPYLRSDLSVDYVSVLLKYIYLIWSSDGESLPNMTVIETEAKLLQWSCALIDSNYQKIVLSKDVAIRDTLQLLNQLIQDHVSSITDLKIVVPMLDNFKKNKSVTKDAHILSLRYSVEQLSLY